VTIDVVEFLYSCIEEIGRERIQADITSDIAASKKYCDHIIAECKNKLGKYADDETLGTLCEAALHFMLTVSLLPSERKVKFRSADLDIVIPSLRSLNRHPEKTLVVQVIKKSNDIFKIKHAESVQPFVDNIWIISANPLNIDHKNYYLDSIDYSFSSIITDVDTFLVDNGITGLKLLHGK